MHLASGLEVSFSGWLMCNKTPQSFNWLSTILNSFVPISVFFYLFLESMTLFLPYYSRMGKQGEAQMRCFCLVYGLLGLAVQVSAVCGAVICLSCLQVYFPICSSTIYSSMEAQSQFFKLGYSVCCLLSSLFWIKFPWSLF